MVHPSPSSSTQARIQGVLERIIYSNEENAYTVGEFRLQEAGAKSRTTSITGVLPGVQCGETLELFGQWSHHPEYGDQFKIDTFASRLPSNVYGIRKYLGSGLVPGIGPKYAERIVDKFGADTLRVITEESKRLQEVEGIGRGRAASIKKSWDDQRAFRDVLMFLQTYGVTTAHCVRLVKKYGAETKQIIQEDPFRLAREIDRIGFKTADKIARNLGLPNESATRIAAGISHTCSNLEEEGHTLIPARDLIAAATTLLEVGGDRVVDELHAMAGRREMVEVRREDKQYYQLPKTAKAESQLAECVVRLLKAPSSLPGIRVDKALEWAQNKAGFAFASEQSTALETALTHKVSILTGGPGTGKTTILRSLVSILAAKKARIQLASPTGRAAQRMADSTGHPASTIHRLLKFDPSEGGFFHGPDNPLDATILIIDESSMLDTRLAAHLLRALKPKAHLLLVGDSDQLPSVGPGNVLKDLIASGKIPVTRLQRIFRQEETSSIVSMAHRILHGETSLPYSANLAKDIDEGHDFHFITADSPEACLQKTIRTVRDYIPDRLGMDPIRDTQVLAPMHKGIVGIQNLNTELQKHLNPIELARQRKNAGLSQSRGTHLRPTQNHFRQRTGKPIPAEIRMGASAFRIGDKVIQTRNNYEKNLFNGDIGLITGISPDGVRLLIDFDGEIHDFEKGELSDLNLAYAISIHKSQGSEYPVVLIPLMKQHFLMLQRNLIYTGVTRGRQKAYVVGDPEAWQIGVHNKEAALRQTDLINKMLDRER